MARMERLEETLITKEDVWCKMRRNHINKQLNLIIKWAVFLSWKLVGVLLWYLKHLFFGNFFNT